MSKSEESGLQRDYCAGQLSLRKLAEIYGITEGAIRKRATKNGWVRSQKKGTQTGTQVRKNGTQKKEVRTENKKTDEQEKKSVSQPKKKTSLTDEKLFLDPDEFGISEQQALFAEHVAAGKTRVEAYRLAGYIGEGNSAYSNASRLMRNARVSRAVRFLRDQRQKRYSANLDELIHQLVAITQADPNELAQYRRVNCRFCWGEDYLYQWRDFDEYDRASKNAAENGKAPPENGGFGFVENSDPNPDCPRCLGEGRGQVFIADTRDIDGPARWLYTGVKETKFGIEVSTASQEAARRDLARLLTARAQSSAPVSGEGQQTKEALELERLRLGNEKLQTEIENLRNGKKDGDLIVVHNALQIPGAIQPTQEDDEGD